MSQRLSDQLGSVLAREPHRLALLPLAHEDGELVRGAAARRRNDAQEVLVEPLVGGLHRVRVVRGDAHGADREDAPESGGEGV